MRFLLVIKLYISLGITRKGNLNILYDSNIA